MNQYTLGDIPDHYPTKHFLPLGEKIWKLFKEQGWEYIENILIDTKNPFFEETGDFFRDKFQIAVRTAQKVMDGQIADPEKIYTTLFFPPVLFVRSDLQMGSIKLLYGESTDITFVVIDDITYKVTLLINGHMEDGAPVDYWIIQGDDEVFERRHIKLGMKLNEIPEKTKDFTKSGYRVLDIMKDIRNERTPQFANSMYSMAMVWTSGAVNMFLEPSNYNVIGQLWDGVWAKRTYGRPDMWFGYVPWPPMIKLLLTMNRPEWIPRIAGLLCENHLFINGFEPRLLQFYRDRPEAWEFVVKNMKLDGVATPRTSIECTPPDYKNKNKYSNEEFNWSYSDNTPILPYEWGLTDEEVFGGINLDITHETPNKPFYGKEHIISMGIGK